VSAIAQSDTLKRLSLAACHLSLDEAQTIASGLLAPNCQLERLESGLAD
jgi:hypothetical protein